MSGASKTNAATTLLAVAVLAAAIASSHALLYKGPVDDLPILHKQPAFMETQGLLTSGLGNIKHGNKLRGSLLLASNTTDREIFAGQEARLVVSSAFLPATDAGVTTRRMWTRFHGKNVTTPAFNISAGNVRVRVIAAYSARNAFSGVTRKCADGDNHDVWTEVWGLSPRALVFGKSIVVSGFATFVVPPFEFRLCVKDITRHNTTTFNQNGQNSDRGLNRGWKEFYNLNGDTVYHFAEPLYYFQAASDNQAGDYAAIKIVARGFKGRYNGELFNPRRFTLGDVVKLVPFGFPCTYEKPTSTTGHESMTGNGLAQYCGTNALFHNGNFRTGVSCQWEGSVGEGVARVGTNRQNPLSTDTTPASYTLSGTMEIPMDNAQFLTAYVKLPEAGSYDICVSTLSFRRVAVNATLRGVTTDAQPLWFKAYDGRDAACTAIATNGGILPAACMSRSTALTVTAATLTDVTYSISDRTHNTWGTIRFTGTGLNFGPATAWDHSATREYATHAGGDMFRIVPEAHFTANPQTVFGDVHKDSRGNVLTTTVVTQEANGRIVSSSSVPRAAATNTGGSLLTATNGRFVQYKLGQPGLGTQSAVGSGSGCFWGGADNYGTSGLLGNPSTRCCTLSSGICSTSRFCALDESGTRGPTANADLGGNPRHPYAPWLADGTGTTAWGYVRFPAGGRHKICYRRANGNWRVISWVTPQLTRNTTFMPVAKNAGYEYHINDTRAETWGAWAVKSRSGATLTTEPSNFWDSSATPATAKGSMFKIVTSTQSCHLATAQAHGYSANAGLLEGPGSKGSADDSSDARQWIYFYARVPKDDGSYTPTYRICFRFGEDNWHALSDPHFAPVYDGAVMINSADVFYPMPKPLVEFTLGDNTQGTWGQFIIRRHAAHIATTQALNTLPNHDQVRLVPNATSGKENFCDRVVGGTDSPQEVNLAREDRDLGAFCAASSGTASDYCFTGKLTPTDGGVNALFPYTMTSPAADANSIAAADGALAFITLPPALNSMSKPQAYKVCYKQNAAANWIEATSAAYGTILTVKAPNTVALVQTSPTLTAGQYGFLRLSAPGTHGIYWATDVLKLVPAAQTCDAPAAGSPSHTGETYSTLVSNGNSLSYAVFANAENVSQVQSSWNVAGQPPTTTAAAFLVFPTGTGSTTASISNYRVCYMRRPTAVATLNWQDVGVIAVADLGIVFAARQQPQQLAYLQVDVISGGAVRLNTNPGMDSAKIVASNTPCTIHQAAFVSGTTYMPNLFSTNTDVGKHVGAYPVDASGVSDLGPGNEVGNRALLEVLLPNTGSSFKVCYKPFGREWIQLAQSATFAHRGVNLTSSTFSHTTRLITAYTVGSSVTGRAAFNNIVLSGAPISSSSHFSFSLSAADAAATATTIKLVKADFEAPEGVFTTIPGRSCFSDGFQTSYTTTVGTSTLYTPWTFPSESGRYLVCVWRNGNWHLASNGATTLQIADNQLRFSRSGNVLTIIDYYGSAIESYGSLNGDDTVYIVNGSGTCGDNSFNNIAPATAERKLNGTAGATSSNATHFVAVRVTDGAITLPTAIGSYRVCVKKSQQSVTASSSTQPFLRSGVYYQVSSVDDNPFLNVGGATQLRISGCNTTTPTPIAAGTTVDLTVTQLDGSGLVYPIGGTTTASTFANLATLAGVTSDFRLRNFGGACRPQDAVRFGFGDANLEQYMFAGSSTFRVAFESNCPGGSCAVRFSSGTLTSSSCAFTVSTTPLTAVEVVSYPTAPCRVNTPCTFRAAALGASALAYAATDAVTVAVAGNSGLAVSGTTSGAFANGYFTFQLTFNPTSFAALSPRTTVSVSVTTAANLTSPAVSFEVIAPSFSAVHIVDVFPADVAGLGVRPLTPTWEPSTGIFYGGNADAASWGSPSVTAASGYHLVAQQFYTVVLRAVGTWPAGEQTYLNSVALVDTTKAITIDTAGLNAAQRVIAASTCQNERCNGALGATPFNAVRVSVTFRLQNNAGCTRASPCTLPFKFGGGNIGASPTQLTTPVRMVATRLVTQCDKDSNFASRSTGIPPAVTSTCTGKPSTVNEGWFLQVTAVDQSGVFVDEYFDGQARAIFDVGMDGWDNGRGVKLTSVSMLSSGWANATTASFSLGQATFRGLTVSRPCSAGNCPIQVVTNWGANIVHAGELVATPNTASLSCSLTTPLMYCSVASGVCTPTTTVSADTLLYTDTQICVAVEAKDANGANTLYETNWVHYFAADKGTTRIPLTITDNSGESAIVRRYRPMRFGRATFCFSVAGTISSRIDFDVTFVAQRFNDAGYWANGATGRCTVGPYALWPKKQVAGLRIVSAAGVELLSGANSNSALLAGLRTGSSALVASVALKAVDHYGRDITATNVDENGNRFQVAVVHSGANVAVTQSGMTQIRGLLNVTIDDATTARNVNSSVAFGLNLHQYCLGCSITFHIVDSGAADPTATVAVTQIPSSGISPTATARFFVVNADPTAVRRLAFYPSSSPLTHWVNGTANVNLTASDPPVLHQSSCLTTSCKPISTTFLLPLNDGRGAANTITGPSSNDIRMQVLTVDAAGSLNAVFEPAGTTLATATAQLDILNSYTVNVQIGNQALHCSGSMTCTDDGTTSVKQTIPAYGATLRDAVLAFPAADGSTHMTKFKLQGLNPSAYAPLMADGRIADSTLPSVSGSFAATATAVAPTTFTVTGISTPGQVFVWRPIAQPRKLVVLDVSQTADLANPAKTWNFLPAASTAQAQFGTATEVAHTYTAEWPVGIAFPITVEVQDANSLRASVSGTVNVAVVEWSGCNNGGLLTASGSLVNGRATIALTFTTPCQNCILEFELATPSGTEWSVMLANPRALLAYSKPLNIVAARPSNNEHVVVTAATPNIFASASTTLTVAESVTLTLEGRAAHSNLAHSRISYTTTSAYTAAVYNRFNSPGSNGWWVGNGGVLRSRADQLSLREHHLAETSGTTLMFMFTRTCSSCSVSFNYRFTNAATSQSIMLPNTFVVRTAGSIGTTVVGFVPRQVARGDDIAVALWHTVTEGGIVAGLPTSGSVATARTVTSTLTNSTNGDGGILHATSWLFTNSEAHRITFSRPSNGVTVTAGSDSFLLVVTTTATHLRPIFTTQTENIITASLGSSRTFSLRAVDDLGFIDVTAGANSCNFGGLPFYCPAASAVLPVSVSIAADGTGAAFPSSESTMIFAQQDHTITGSIAHGQGTVSVRFNSPIRAGVPVFSVAGPLSSMLSASRPAFQVPVVTVSNGLRALELVAIPTSDKTKVSTAGPWFVDVALVNAMTDDVTPANRYVAVSASNTVTMTTSGCSSLSLNTATSFQLDRGYRRVPITFLDQAASCTITFTASSCTGAACTTAITGVAVKKVTADSFRYLRPTTLDNNGAAAGPMFGAAGRKTFVTVQLFGADGNNVAVPVGSAACPTCALRITNAGTSGSNCAFTTSKTFETFDVNGTATISLTWNDANVARYDCQIRVEVGADTNFATFLRAPDASLAHTPTVSVCRPVRVVMVTNTSTAYRGMFLRTGAPYAFEARTVDATGARCFGDSQDEATQLTVEAVTTGTVPALSTQIFAINLNRTDTTSAGFANGLQSVDVARTTVRAVAGQFVFAVAFSNSTVALGLPGVRVRVTATSVAPDISGANRVALSGAVETVIAASTLRFAPHRALPRNVVTGRVLQTAPNRTSDEVIVQAVDALNPMWASALVAAPNVARRSTEGGNDESVFWQQMPPPIDGQLKVNFARGAATATLRAGEASWSGLTWTGPDGQYELTVASAEPGSQIRPAQPFRFFAQEPRLLALDVTNFTASAATVCTANCELSNRTFTRTVNASIDAAPFLVVESLNAFNVSVFVSDGASSPVLGDSESVIEATLVGASAATSVQFGRPPAYRELGSVFARVRNGVARFELGFLGSTAINGNNANHSLVEIQFSCPTVRPAHLVMPFETPANPCSFAGFRTMKVLVNDRRPANLFRDAPTTNRDVLKVEFGVTDFSAINITRFVSDLAGFLEGNGFPWVNPRLAAQFIRVTLCGVTRFFDITQHDLVGVCGQSGACNVLTGALNCPPQVLACRCPNSAARGAMLSRYLLQTPASNATANYSNVVAEVFFDLQYMPGFPGFTEAALAQAYTQLQTTARSWFTLPAVVAEYKISRAATRPFGFAGNAATLEPTPVPFVPPPPTPAPAPPTEEPEPDAAAPFSVLLAAALGLLLALLA